MIPKHKRILSAAKAKVFKYSENGRVAGFPSEVVEEQPNQEHAGFEINADNGPDSTLCGHQGVKEIALISPKKHP